MRLLTKEDLIITGLLVLISMLVLCYAYEKDRQQRKEVMLKEYEKYILTEDYELKTNNLRE